MGNPSYINRFIDILRSPLGRPLLNQLAASSDKLAALLYFPPAPANSAGAPPPPVSVDAVQHHARIQCTPAAVWACHINMQNAACVACEQRVGFDVKLASAFAASSITAFM